MTETKVSIPADGARLEGDLTLPADAKGLVIFAHGSGSSRLSPRDRFVAAKLQSASIGTLLVDLLTEKEDQVDRVTGQLSFDIAFLSARLARVVDWAGGLPAAHGLRLGVFGANTGAAAALAVAARRPATVNAVVSRGGRPDLAEALWSHVTAPTLLIVGAEDDEALDLNCSAAQALPDARVAVVRRASHLFEEPGALDAVARLACDWFLDHLGAGNEKAEPMLPFADRSQAGELLALRLERYRGRADVIVLGLPRGGVPVAAVVARHLGAPLDVLVARKLGTPGQEEVALGAIAPGGVRVMNPEIAAYVSDWAIDEEIEREQLELRRRERRFRGVRPPPTVRGLVAILVDDGLATGATMRAAVAWARRNDAARVVVAVPVAPTDTVEHLAREADEVVCVATSADFGSVGLYYRDFRPVSEDEVVAILEGPSTSPPALAGS